MKSFELHCLNLFFKPPQHVSVFILTLKMELSSLSFKGLVPYFQAEFQSHCKAEPLLSDTRLLISVAQEVLRLN